VKYEVGMRVEARDNGREWKPGAVTCVNPLRVKLDTELSGVSWDEVRPLDESKPKTGALAEITKKITEDAISMVKEAALADLKFAVDSVREVTAKGDATAEEIKGAKLRVAQAIKAAQDKGVSQEELVEASSAMGKAKEAQEKKEEALKPEKKVKKEPVVIEFDNPAVGEAVKEAAAQAKEDGKTLPEIIMAAVAAAKAVEGASDEDVKKAKKAAAAAAMEESSSSSGSDDSSDTEYETELAAAEKAKAKREGIAAAFYFNAK